MTPLSWILVCSVVGFLLLATEVCVPGLILGMLGLLSLIIAAGIAYTAYGAMTGSLVLAGLGLVTIIGFIVWMIIFPNTPIGRRIMLRRNLDPGEGNKRAPAADVIGRQGIALTPLRPAGTALIEGRRMDVVAENAFITKDSPIVVVLQEGLRIVVRETSLPQHPVNTPRDRKGGIQSKSAQEG